jgi:hypothetical protein
LEGQLAQAQERQAQSVLLDEENAVRVCVHGSGVGREFE